MTAFAATDVTVTLPAQNVDVFPGVKRATLATVTFGNSTLTYATGGVPLPAIGKFGMKRAIDMFIIQQPAAAALEYRYDADNKKLMILDEDNTSGVLAELANGNAPASVSLKVLVIGE
jgi:hypothetical protein